MRFLETLIANKKHMLTAVFLAGFALDNVMLTRVDLGITVVALSVYLAAATMGVVLLSAARGGVFVSYLTQFAFGGLLSGYFIFFTRSASFASSWFFILLLVVAIAGNEFLKEEYRRFELRVAMLFAAFLFFAIIYVPVVAKQMGAIVFLASGLVSVAAIMIVIVIAARVAPEVVRVAGRTLTVIISGMFVGINILYFTNIIPPIPLSLKDAGVYHEVVRTDGGYAGRGEEVRWYDFAHQYRPVFHRTSGEPVYFYSAVFAPTALNTTILHEWQHFDEARGEWVTADRFGFSIAGGRDGGYRGYSVKQSVVAGLWRVNVTTDRGQLLGRTTFTVADMLTSPALTTKQLE